MGCFLRCFSEVTAVEDRYKDNDKDPSSHKTITLKEPVTHHDHNHDHNHDRDDNRDRDRSHEHTKLSRAPSGSSDKSKSRTPCEEKKETGVEDGDKLFIAAQTFTYRELAAATKYFRTECVLGEGGFGRVYKGFLESTGQTVAVKQLDRNGLQGNREFLVEVLMLSMLHHPNLVNLIGYCADGDQRILVYEYMPNGSLEDHLHDLPPGKESLDWNTRMKIAAGAAKGLEYLHEKANPPVIYRDLKSPNILLDEMFRPKLSDFGLAKLGPIGDKSHVSTRVMGTYGYCAPEYARTGQLTLKSDVYSFGVVLLELITGRKAIDYSKSVGEQNLVAWAHPLFKERRKFPQMADPLLKGQFPMKGFCQALAVAAMCLQDEGSARPGIGDVVTALSYLTSQAYDPGVAQPVPINRREKKEKEKEKEKDMNPNAEVQEFEDKGLDLPQAPSIKEPTKTRATTDRTATTPSSVKKKECSDDDSDKINAQNSSEAEQKDKKLADRERAVAEARNWGANWREKMRGS